MRYLQNWAVRFFLPPLYIWKNIFIALFPVLDYLDQFKAIKENLLRGVGHLDLLRAPTHLRLCQKPKLVGFFEAFPYYQNALKIQRKLQYFETCQVLITNVHLWNGFLTVHRWYQWQWWACYNLTITIIGIGCVIAKLSLSPSSAWLS